MGGLSNKPIPTLMSIWHPKPTGCKVMQWTIVLLSPKPQMSERGSSTICSVVERPDHHCGDDLVLQKWRCATATVNPKLAKREVMSLSMARLCRWKWNFPNYCIISPLFSLSYKDELYGDGVVREYIHYVKFTDLNPSRTVDFTVQWNLHTVALGPLVLSLSEYQWGVACALWHLCGSLVPIEATRTVSWC